MEYRSNLMNNRLHLMNKMSNLIKNWPTLISELTELDCFWTWPVIKYVKTGS
jgi:hypothetical protein